MIVSVSSSLPGSMPGSFEYMSSWSTKASRLLSDVENGLYEGSSRTASDLNVEEARARAQGVRRSRGSDISIWVAAGFIEKALKGKRELGRGTGRKEKSPREERER